MKPQKWVFVLLLLVLLAIIGCVKDQGMPPTPTPSNPPLPALSPTPSFMEQKGEDLGVYKDKNGNLSVSGVPDIRVKRLLAYWNAEAKTMGRGKCYPYKLSGKYEEKSGLGYTDNAHYEIQFSFDSCDAAVNLAALAEQLDIHLTDKNHIVASGKNQHTKGEAILRYLNAEILKDGKIKARYVFKENDARTIISDRLDVFIQLSFDSPFNREDLELEPLEVRTDIPVFDRQKEIIARTAVEFSQLLQKPSELTITLLNFTGDAPHYFEWSYIFDEKATEVLQNVHRGQTDLKTNDILALALVKKRLVEAQRGPSVRILPGGKEPLNEEEMQIVARVAQETARNIDPETIIIIVYDFKGDAPSRMTTWAYLWDVRGVAAIKKGGLSAQEILRKASVVEAIGIIPGGESVPPIKPILSEREN